MKKYIINGKTSRNTNFKLKSLLKVQYILVRILNENLKSLKKYKNKVKIIVIYSETQQKAQEKCNPGINYTMINPKVTIFKTVKANNYRE